MYQSGRSDRMLPYIFQTRCLKKGKCQKAIKQEDKQNEEPNERWLLTHEVVNEEEDILRWTWCGLFRTREPALKLLKKNVKRIVDEYDERFPEIRVNEDEETLEENVLIGRTDRFQRFRLLKLIEEP